MSQELVETGQKYISVLKTNKTYKKGDCVNDLIFIGYVHRKSGIRENGVLNKLGFILISEKYYVHVEKEHDEEM